MVILDGLDLMLEISTELGESASSTPQLLSCSLRILLYIFSKRQSVGVLQHAFALQRSIVAKVSFLINWHIIVRLGALRVCG